MQDLTLPQKRILSFIIQCKERGLSPTIREISEHFGYKSANNARQHLRLIERKGYLRLLPGKARGIELSRDITLNGERAGLKVPLVGIVAAGKPITAIENIEEYITLDKNLFKGPGLFTLRVKGDSMKGVGILDGDIAIIRRQSSVQTGDIVVALIEGEATLKRYLQQEKKIIFRAENPDFSDICVSFDQANQVHIAGKLIGVIRKV